MRKLVQGIVDFRKNLTKEKRELFAKLALGQKPDTLFIACSDSRVVPNLFASTNPGDLFVLRNIGNVVPPLNLSMQEDSAAAAIEFAVFSLKVTDVVICGHSECGAIQAIAEGIDNCSCQHVKNWLRHGVEALHRVEKGKVIDEALSRHNQISQENVLLQIEHMMSYPFIAKLVQENKLQVHGWWFDIAHADVYCYEASLGKFIVIDEKEAALILTRLG